MVAYVNSLSEEERAHLVAMAGKRSRVEGDDGALDAPPMQHPHRETGQQPGILHSNRVCGESSAIQCPENASGDIGGGVPRREVRVGHVYTVGTGVQRFRCSRCRGQRVWDLEEVVGITYLGKVRA